MGARASSTVEKVRDLDDGYRALVRVTRPDGSTLRYKVGRQPKRGSVSKSKRA